MLSGRPLIPCPRTAQDFSLTLVNAQVSEAGGIIDPVGTEACMQDWFSPQVCIKQDFSHLEAC